MSLLNRVEGLTPPSCLSAESVMSRGRQTFRPSEFRKDIWGHLGPKFTLASFAESLITSEIYGQSRRKKEMPHRADLQPHPVFFFSFLITLGMTSHGRILE